MWGRIQGLTSKDMPVSVFLNDKPQDISSNGESTFDNITVGDNHIILIDNKKRVHVLGDNEFG